MYKKKEKGFTLIELLVVVAIISLLSSVVFSSLKTAKAKARDAARISAVHEVQSALELYYIDNGGYYPFRNPNNLSWSVALSNGLTPKYIKEIPANTPVTSPYQYYAFSSATGPGSKYYAISVPYEKKNPCYVCVGTSAECSDAGVALGSIGLCK